MTEREPDKEKLRDQLFSVLYQRVRRWWERQT